MLYFQSGPPHKVLPATSRFHAGSSIACPGGTLKSDYLAFMLFIAFIAFNAFSSAFSFLMVAFCFSMVVSSCWLCLRCLAIDFRRNRTWKTSFSISSPRKRAAAPFRTGMDFTSQDIHTQRMLIDQLEPPANRKPSCMYTCKQEAIMVIC